MHATFLEFMWIYVRRKQCEEYPKAEEHYMAAYHLLLQTVGYGEFHNSSGICSRFDVSGKQSPLFGKQARHAAANWELRCWNCRWTANVGASQANLQINQGRYVEADCMWRGFWLETGQYLCLTAWIVVILLVCVLNCVRSK